MAYANQNQLKELAGKTITIKKVFPAYRKGFNNATKKFETFKLVNWVWNQESWVEKERVLAPREPNFKTHKKVYDISITLDSSETVGDVTDDNFIFSGVGAKKIKDMAEATVAFGKIPQREDGTPEYDWEEKFIDELEWKQIVFSTKNVKTTIDDKNIEYAELTFREVKSTSNVNDDKWFDEELPF